MTDVIQLLPDSIANQIAAGEVVQRPASVVKELLENAIDAGAQHIQLIIKDAGKSLIQVADDGSGMSETDARMCFERHATSKIRQAHDLFAIKTMGFRGEAMASIAAVAQVELRTKRKEDETGTSITIEGSQLKSQETIACQPGTSITVKNLFYNVPARRNFLKSNHVEMRHIMDEFQRVALSYPEIAFNCFQNDIEVYQLKAAKLGQRIVHLFGKNYQQQLVPCEETVDKIKVKGYVGKPEQSKKARGEQFFYVNNRFIKSPYLNHAVINAYERLIPEGYHPFFVLFIYIDPKHVDVNVHPTKTEIKFDDEKTVYTIIKSAVKRSLGAYNLTPSMDYTVDTNFFENQGPTPSVQSAPKEGHSQNAFPTRGHSNQKNWDKLYIEAFETERSEELAKAEAQQYEEQVIFGSAANAMGISSPRESRPKNLFQIQNKYISTPVKSGLMILDQQSAHERILFERFNSHLNTREGDVQQFLFPETIELSAADYSLVKELWDEIQSMGFAVEEFGKNAIALQGAPSSLAGQNIKTLFIGLIEDYKQNIAEFSFNKKENIARAMAKNASIKRGEILSIEEMQGLIDQLFACENPNYTPSGAKTFVVLESNNLDSFFNR